MSRDPYRSSAGDVSLGGRGGTRWDSERFAMERDRSRFEDRFEERDTRVSRGGFMNVEGQDLKTTGTRDGIIMMMNHDLNERADLEEGEEQASRLKRRGNSIMMNLLPHHAELLLLDQDS
jgi:hypothetical protein